MPRSSLQARMSTPLRWTRLWSIWRANLTQHTTSSMSGSSSGPQWATSQELIQELAPRISHDALTAIWHPLDEAIRTRFMCSMRNEAILKALFMYKEEELTFAKAIVVAIPCHSQRIWCRMLAGGHGFTKIDLAGAYNQIMLTPESQRWLALSTHREVLLQIHYFFLVSVQLQATSRKIWPADQWPPRCSCLHGWHPSQWDHHFGTHPEPLCSPQMLRGKGAMLPPGEVFICTTFCQVPWTYSISSGNRQESKNWCCQDDVTSRKCF